MQPAWQEEKLGFSKVNNKFSEFDRKFDKKLSGFQSKIFLTLFTLAVGAVAEKLYEISPKEVSVASVISGVLEEGSRLYLAAGARFLTAQSVPTSLLMRHKPSTAIAFHSFRVR